MKKLSVALSVLVLLAGMSAYFTAPLNTALAEPEWVPETIRHAWGTTNGYPDRFIDEITFTMQIESGTLNEYYEMEILARIDEIDYTLVEWGLSLNTDEYPGKFRFFVTRLEPPVPPQEYYQYYTVVDFVDIGYSRRFHTFWFWIKKEEGKTWHFKMYDCDTQELLYDMSFDHVTVETCSEMYIFFFSQEFWMEGCDTTLVSTGQTLHPVDGEWHDWHDYDWQYLAWSTPIPEHGGHGPLYHVDEAGCCQGPMAAQQAILNVTKRPPGDTLLPGPPDTIPKDTTPSYTVPLDNQWAVPETILSFDEFAYLAHVGMGMGAEYHRIRTWQVPE